MTFGCCLILDLSFCNLKLGFLELIAALELNEQTFTATSRKTEMSLYLDLLVSWGTFGDCVASAVVCFVG